MGIGGAIWALPDDPTESGIREDFQIDSMYIQPWVDALFVREPYLTDKDFHAAAQKLHVDDATIHAVVDIEAGTQHKGLFEEGKPVVNFSLDLFRQNAKKRGVDLKKYTKKYPEVFSAPNRAKYGSQNAAQWARMQAAMAIDSVAAIESAYWGMFQIGGFNWKKCGARSAQEFAKMMMRSEHDQLDLFVNFLHSTGLDEPLQKHDWNRFARGYNGTGYAKRGYHTRLKKAYNKYK